MIEYYRHLSRVQNSVELSEVDIMTITGFMEPEQKFQHLRRYADLTKDAEAQSYCADRDF